MRRLVLALETSLVCTALLTAQDTPVFRTGTTLIEFTFIAVDGNGNPVTNLKQDEVQLREDGKPREVAFFRYEGAPSDPEAVRPLPAGLFTNRVEYAGGPPSNVTVILIDALNTPPADQELMRRHVASYLETVETDTRVAVYGLGANGITVVHGFSSDIASLRAGMEEGLKRFPVQATPDVQEIQCFVGRFLEWPEDVSTCQLPGTLLEWELFGAETLAFQAAAERRRNASLAALEAIGDHLAGIPGRKNLVWMGRGFSSASITGVFGTGKYGSRTSYVERIRRTAERLASQGVVVYPLDSRAMLPGQAKPRPTMMSQQGPPGRDRRDVWIPTTNEDYANAKVQIPARTMAGFISSHDPWPTMDIMAAVTGGRVVKLTNDISAGARAAANDTRASYTIGFYAVAQPDGRWHNLEVNVRRRGIRVTHRQGYLASAVTTEAPVWTEDRWRQVIASPIGSTLVRVDGRCERVASHTVTLLLQVVSEDLQFRRVDGHFRADVDIGIAERMPDGDTSFSVNLAEIVLKEAQGDPATSVARLAKQWTLRPTTSAIVVVVRDRFTSRYGTLEIPVAQIPAATGDPQP